MGKSEKISSTLSGANAELEDLNAVHLRPTQLVVRCSSIHSRAAWDHWNTCMQANKTDIVNQHLCDMSCQVCITTCVKSCVRLAHL